MLEKPDKLPEIEPSLDLAQENWSKFQIKVYEESKKKLKDKAIVLYTPAITYHGVVSIRTRPDCLILWGSGNNVHGLISVNATVKYHLDDLVERIKKLKILGEVADCPVSLSSIFYKEHFYSDYCSDCSHCSRPDYLPIIVTEKPYEGACYAIVDQRFHLMDFKTYLDLITDFEKIKKKDYPNQYIINKYRPFKCPDCGANCFLHTVWTCPYVDGYFADGCDFMLEEINGKGLAPNYENCCNLACPRFLQYGACESREFTFAYICSKCTDKKCIVNGEKAPLCPDCNEEFPAI